MKKKGHQGLGDGKIRPSGSSQRWPCTPASPHLHLQAPDSTAPTSPVSFLTSSQPLTVLLCWTIIFQHHSGRGEHPLPCTTCHTWGIIVSHSRWHYRSTCLWYNLGLKTKKKPKFFYRWNVLSNIIQIWSLRSVRS